MIIPVKKTPWHLHVDKPYSSSQLQAAGYTGTRYKQHWVSGHGRRNRGVRFWVCFDGTTSPEFTREYMATNWFMERVATLLKENAK